MLKKEGYDLGNLKNDVNDEFGELIVKMLKLQEQQMTVFRGKDGVKDLMTDELRELGVEMGADEVLASRLKGYLRYPEEWGPTEWGPIPFLPSNNILIEKLEKQWGNLNSYKGYLN